MTSENKLREAANEILNTRVNRAYHVGLPINLINEALELNGFEMEEGIYCGAEGRVHEKVGPNSWLAMHWFKMASGRFEVTAYVS